MSANHMHSILHHFPVFVKDFQKNFSNDLGTHTALESFAII